MGWRTVAKLTVRAPQPVETISAKTPRTGKGTHATALTGAPVIGIFAPGTHHVLPLLSSVAHHPGEQKKRNGERARVRARELDGRSERAIESERAS